MNAEALLAARLAMAVAAGAGALCARHTPHHRCLPAALLVVLYVDLVRGALPLPLELGAALLMTGAGGAVVLRAFWASLSAQMTVLAGAAVLWGLALVGGGSWWNLAGPVACAAAALLELGAVVWWVWQGRTWSITQRSALVLTIGDVVFCLAGSALGWQARWAWVLAVQGTLVSLLLAAVQLRWLRCSSPGGLKPILWRGRVRPASTRSLDRRLASRQRMVFSSHTPAAMARRVTPTTTRSTPVSTSMADPS